MTMLLFTWTLFILITFSGFCYTFGGKTMNDRSNGAKVTSAGLLDAWGKTVFSTEAEGRTMLEHDTKREGESSP